MGLIRLVLVSACLGIAMANAASAGELTVGTANAAPGTSVTVPVTYAASGQNAVAVASDVRYNTAIFKNPRCEGGSGLPANKSVRCGTPKKGILRIAVFGLNTDTLASGEVAKITFDVASGAKQGRYKLRNKPSAADKDGNDFRLAHEHGVVRVASN